MFPAPSAATPRGLLKSAALPVPSAPPLSANPAKVAKSYAIASPVGSGVTANVTGTLVVDPDAFIATIRNCSPDIAAVEAPIANVGASDPLKPFPSARLVHVLPPSV